MAFLCFQDGHSDLYMTGPDGSEIVNVTNSPAEEHSPAWSPEGNWLAFISNKDGDIDVYKVCVTCPGDAETVRLTDAAQPGSWTAWSPDGDWLAYVVGQDLMRVKDDRSGASFLAGGVFGPPIWRP